VPRCMARRMGWPVGCRGSVLNDIFAGQIVLVRDRYSGYRPFQGLVILLIEVQPGENAPPCRFHSPGTYIVKIAFEERQADLKGEIDSWNAARPDYLVHDNSVVSEHSCHGNSGFRRP
jgi:hypothetical protein